MPTLDLALHARVVRIQLHERLRGHVTSPNWLPDDWPELADLREEQHRLVGQVTAAIDELKAVRRRFASEDRQYDDAMRAAQRAGRPDVGMEDPRTPETERVAAIREAEAWLFAGAEILAECVDRCIATIREHEGIWLGGLRLRAAGVADRRRELEDELARLQNEEFTLVRRGHWLQATADDQGILGRNPVPRPGEPTPARFPAELVDTAFERPWHRLRDWSEVA
jgi:hypothetical protein